MILVKTTRRKKSHLLSIVDTLLLGRRAWRIIVHRPVRGYTIHRAIGCRGYRRRIVVLVRIPRWNVWNSRIEDHPVTFLCNCSRTRRCGGCHRWLGLVRLDRVHDIMTGSSIWHGRGTRRNIWRWRGDEICPGIVVHGLLLGDWMHHLLLGVWVVCSLRRILGWVERSSVDSTFRDV